MDVLTKHWSNRSRGNCTNRGSVIASGPESAARMIGSLYPKWGGRYLSADSTERHRYSDLMKSGYHCLIEVAWVPGSSNGKYTLQIDYQMLSVGNNNNKPNGHFLRLSNAFRPTKSTQIGVARIKNHKWKNSIIKELKRETDVWILSASNRILSSAVLLVNGVMVGVYMPERNPVKHACLTSPVQGSMQQLVGSDKGQGLEATKARI